VSQEYETIPKIMLFLQSYGISTCFCFSLLFSTFFSFVITEAKNMPSECRGGNPEFLVPMLLRGNASQPFVNFYAEINIP